MVQYAAFVAFWSRVETFKLLFPATPDWPSVTTTMECPAFVNLVRLSRALMM